MTALRQILRRPWLGAYIGARIFDSSGSYAIAFAIMLASSVIALILTLMYRGRPTESPAFQPATGK